MIDEEEVAMDGPEFKGSIFEEFGRVAAAFGSSKRVEISDLLAQGWSRSRQQLG